MTEETTPLHDELKNTPAPTQSTPTEVTPAPAPEEDEADEHDGNAETAKSYKVDVERALARETQDGKGDEDPGPSDFQGFATEGVEKESN